MITTTLNAQGQTQPLRNTTLAYDAEELDTLLAAPPDQARNARSTQVLSPTLLAQILAGGTAAADDERKATDFIA